MVARKKADIPNTYWKMTIRPSKFEDIPTLLEIAEEARQTMRASGNTRQWVNGYPSETVFAQDIKRGVSYVIEREGTVVATFALVEGPDITYNKIYEGAWLNDQPYYVIHRIASRKGVRGVLIAALDFAFERTENIRIDTHRDNVIMQHLLGKYGFAYCGIIYLLNGDERLAYQKINDKSFDDNLI